MGIKELWSILTPFCERKPLYELQGKVVAVDLSCWICEAQNISEYQVQPRMYLRNLYFRTCYLLLMEVIPVFVLEGKAPELKYQTIADRNAIQFKGAKPKTDKVKTGKDRSRFHFVLKQCEDMLRYMGLACITGSGEAESMCAYLNEDGMVAGCISQDSDCFAYGAQVVFRNFSISSQGSYAASGGAVDVYDIRKANEFLKFGRNKIIALALLCGSDYNEGIHGVGRDSATKFMNRYEDAEILDQMRSWRQKSNVFDDLENKIGDKNICTSCGHFGKVQSHTKSGCVECKTTKGCDFSKYREQRLDIKNELSIRTKALSDPNFPNEELIKEYLVKKDNVKKLDLRWKQPNLVSFVKFTNKFLGWDEIYSFEKFLPILTRWQCLNYEHIMKCLSENRLMEIRGILQPNYIKKKRSPKGVASYEIIWEDTEGFFKHLIPEEQIEKYKETNKTDVESLWSTIEPANLVEKAYPKLVEEFLEKKNKKAKKPTKRKKKEINVDDLNELLQNTSISEPKPKKTRKKIGKKEQKTLENFLNNKENLESKVLTPKNKNCTPKGRVNVLKNQEKLLSTSFDLDASNFGDEDDLDISDIIDDIVNRGPKLPKRIEKLGYVINSFDNKVHFEVKNDCFNVENHQIYEEIASKNDSFSKILTKKFEKTAKNFDQKFEKNYSDEKTNSDYEDDVFSKEKSVENASFSHILNKNYGKPEENIYEVFENYYSDEKNSSDDDHVFSDEKSPDNNRFSHILKQNILEKSQKNIFEKFGKKYSDDKISSDEENCGNSEGKSSENVSFSHILSKKRHSNFFEIIDDTQTDFFEKSIRKQFSDEENSDENDENSEEKSPENVSFSKILTKNFLKNNRKSGEKYSDDGLSKEKLVENASFSHIVNENHEISNRYEIFENNYSDEKLSSDDIFSDEKSPKNASFSHNLTKKRSNFLKKICQKNSLENSFSDEENAENNQFSNNISLENDSESGNLNRSNFFATKFTEVDLFEKSMNKKDSSDNSDEDTIEYDVEDGNSEEKEESFEGNYVPLIERLKKFTKT